MKAAPTAAAVATAASVVNFRQVVYDEGAGSLEGEGKPGVRIPLQRGADAFCGT